MIRFRYMPIKFNYSSRRGAKVKYLVIHDTGNTSKGAGALNHYRYFSGGNRNASAHYFVDDKEIIQVIGDSLASWHCGDNQGKGRALNGVTNSNSIGIEMCVNSDGDYRKAFENLVELVKNLMVKFNIPAHNVCRHYDVSRKSCPNSFKANNWARWEEFKRLIKEPIKTKLDLSKDSVGVSVAQEEAKKPLEKNQVRIIINGQEKIFKGQKINNRNYVGVRDLAEALGFIVDWDAGSDSVIIRR